MWSGLLPPYCGESSTRDTNCYVENWLTRDINCYVENWLTRDTNCHVENWFTVFKHNFLRKKLRQKVGGFERKMYESLKGRIIEYAESDSQYINTSRKPNNSNSLQMMRGG